MFVTNSIKIKDLFNVNCGDTATVCQFTGHSEQDLRYLPNISSNYVFNETLRDILGFLIEPCGDSLYIFGPTGCGKSTIVSETAARLKWPTIQVTGNGGMDLSDLIGHVTVKNKCMEFMDGPLTVAMKYGYIFVLNKMDLVSPAQLMGINDILANQQLVIVQNNNEVVKPHPNFRFIATGNSNGSGDKTGRYKGVYTQNFAFMDRFRLLPIDYMSIDEEVKLLHSVNPKLPAKIVQVMCKVASEIRKLHLSMDRDNSLDITISTRSLLRWAHLYLSYAKVEKPLITSMEKAFLFRASQREQLAVTKIVEAMLCQKKLAKPLPQDEHIS